MSYFFFSNLRGLAGFCRLSKSILETKTRLRKSECYSSCNERTPYYQHMGLSVCQPMKSEGILQLGLWFPLAWRMRKFFAGIFDQWPILRCLGLVGHQRQATQLVSLGNDTPCTWLVIVVKKRRIDISYPHKFRITARNSYFWYKIKGTSWQF